MEDQTPKSKSIFDTASELSKTHKQKREETYETSFQPTRKEGEKMVTEELVLKGKKIHDELSSKIDTIFTVHQILPSKYRNYLSSQKNFSAKDWQSLERQKKENEELLIALGKKIGRTTTPPQAKKEKELSPSSEPEKKPPVKKGKIITKRHWIGM